MADKITARDALLTAVLTLAVHPAIGENGPMAIRTTIDHAYKKSPGYRADTGLVVAAAQVVCDAILGEGLFKKEK